MLICEIFFYEIFCVGGLLGLTNQTSHFSLYKKITFAIKAFQEQQTIHKYYCNRNWNLN